MPGDDAARAQRRPRQRLVIALAVVMTAAGVIVPVTVATAAPTIVLTVNSNAWGGADATKGNGVCETATGNGNCTLRAAIEESNALNRPAGEVLITVSSSIGVNTAMTGTPNQTANFMQGGNLTRQDTNGAQYAVTAPVIIDLGHRLVLDGSANDSNENAMFYLNGPDIQILNADHVLSSGSSFVIGANANNIALTGDTVGYNGGFGQVATTRTWNPERFAVIVQGAKNVTISNYKISGYYDNAHDSGIFLFSNPTGTAPSSITTNIVVDNVQLLYNTSGGCGGSDGSGCRAPLINFWSNSNTDNNGFPNNVINGLTFNNLVVQNLPSNMQGMQFADNSATSVGTNSCDITNLTITNSRFTNNAQSGSGAAQAFIMLPYTTYLHGTNLIANNVFISPNTTGSQTGANTAIFLLGNEPSGSTKASGLTIANNYFNGYGNANGTIRLRQAGLVTVTGNTFGSATKSYANTSEETADTNVQVSLAPTQGTPYLSSNQAILPWYPSSANAPVLAGPLPSTALPLRSAPDTGLPTCTATVQVARSTAATTYNSVPADPVTLDVFWTAAQTSEVYLGQVTDVKGPNATLGLALPIGAVTLPDGQKVTPVNPTTGVASGFVRVQTQVQGLTQLESSQYSRVVPVAGSCAPALTLNQAAGMTDPTTWRDLHFTLTSTTPLDLTTISLASIGVTATPVPQTIDAARLNPRVVSVTVVADSGDTTFDIIVRVDDSATVKVTLGANTVATPAGFANPAAATSTDNAITFLNPVQVTPAKFPLVTGEPNGKDVTISLAAGAPLPTADLVFTTTVTQPPGTPLVTLSTTGPILQAGQTSTAPVTVKAAAGSVAANTPTSIALTLETADPNYDGLVVPTVAPYLFSTDPIVHITKTAYAEVADASSPAQVEATGTPALDAARLVDGQTLCFVYTVTNTSADDWATSLTAVTVTDTDTRLGTDGVIGTIASLAIGQTAKLAACTSLLPVDTTATGGTGG